MSGTWKRAAFAMVEATVMLVVSAASAGAGASPGPEVMVRIETSSQKEILARGLTVRVSNKGTGPPLVTLHSFSRELAEVFALYLEDYRDVLIFYEGRRVDPGSAIAAPRSVRLRDIDNDGATHPVELEIMNGAR